MFVGVLVMSASSADLASAAIGDISTAAGTGSQFEAVNDGGPATAAGLDTPRGITSTPDGGFLVTDQEHDRVRYVSPATARPARLRPVRAATAGPRPRRSSTRLAASS